jgi:hypothetical protein
MSLYLCVMDTRSEYEHDGVEVGPYSYFGEVRNLLRVELSRVGLKAPLFLDHIDSFGEWPPGLLEALQLELTAIESTIGSRPSRMISDSAWYVSWYAGSRPNTLREAVVDIEGDPLIPRLLLLVEVAKKHRLPILFQ